jgi:CBS-domain-containing membrane protein
MSDLPLSEILSSSSTPITISSCASEVVVAGPETRTSAGYKIRTSVHAYFSKWRSQHVKSPALPPLSEVTWSFIGSFMCIAFLAALTYNLVGASTPVDYSNFVLIVGSMGATATLIYAAPSSPLAQPRNAIGGHVLSAIIGVAVRVVITDAACGGRCLWLGCALGVSLSISVMQLTGTLHPPGGAIALIAVAGGPGISALSWWYVLFPAALGSVLMVIVGVLVNNLSPLRAYPQRWL